MKLESPFSQSIVNKVYDTVRLGLHPELAGDRIGELPLFEALATETRYFGEIGLDGSPQYKSTQELQLRAFEFIALDALKVDQFLLSDVLAIASRLEEPFRSIAEREATRAGDTGRPSTIANTLREQSRMHPAICELVSNTFYKRQLVSSDRVKARKPTVECADGFPASPVVILDVPSLSVVKRRAFEQTAKRSYRNEVEATALLAAMKKLRPVRRECEPVPTLVVLSPYLAQVNHLERLLKPEIDVSAGTLFGFASPRGDGKFV